MKKYLVILGTFALTFAATAQQRPMQSLYMFDPLLINPAYAGTQVQLSATGIYRNQWVNFPGAPKTFTFTAHSGFRKTRAGVGIIAGRDVIGIHGENSLYFVYSYRIPLSKYSKTSLSFGVQGGFNDLKSDFSKLTVQDPNDPFSTVVNRNFTWNFGGGLFLRGEKFFAGVSVPYGLNNSYVNYQDLTSTAKQRRYYYLSGGYSYQVSPVIKLIPTTLIRLQERAPLSMDISLVTVFYDVVGLGVSYRNGGGWTKEKKTFSSDAIVALFELQINTNFHVGYAYDFTASGLAQYSNGSHEIMLNYRIKIPKLHKGLECPTYW
jgi:type IX secretion system PorP/SprF family membrane protein